MPWAVSRYYSRHYFFTAITLCVWLAQRFKKLSSYTSIAIVTEEFFFQPGNIILIVRDYLVCKIKIWVLTAASSSLRHQRKCIWIFALDSLDKSMELTHKQEEYIISLLSYFLYDLFNTYDRKPMIAKDLNHRSESLTY